MTCLMFLGHLWRARNHGVDVGDTWRYRIPQTLVAASRYCHWTILE